MDLAVVGNFAQWLCSAQKFVFDLHGKVVKGLVGPDIMTLRIFLRQEAAKFVFRNQKAYLG